MGQDASACLVFGFKEPSNNETWLRAAAIVGDDPATSEYTFEFPIGEMRELRRTNWQGKEITERWQETETRLKDDETLESEDLLPVSEPLRAIFATRPLYGKPPAFKHVSIGRLASDEWTEELYFTLNELGAGCGWGNEDVGGRDEFIVTDAHIEALYRAAAELEMVIEGEPRWYMNAEFS